MICAHQPRSESKLNRHIAKQIRFTHISSINGLRIVRCTSSSCRHQATTGRTKSMRACILRVTCGVRFWFSLSLGWPAHYSDQHRTRHGSMIPWFQALAHNKIENKTLAERFASMRCLFRRSKYHFIFSPTIVGCILYVDNNYYFRSCTCDVWNGLFRLRAAHATTQHYTIEHLRESPQKASHKQQNR